MVIIYVKFSILQIFYFYSYPSKLVELYVNFILYFYIYIYKKLSFQISQVVVKLFLILLYIYMCMMTYIVESRA